MEDLYLDIKGVCKSFGGNYALDHVDFNIIRGEVHCLIGQNGSGKSTLIKILSGVYTWDGCPEFTIGGERVLHLTPHDSMNQGIQVIYQDLSLFPNMTVAENIAYIVSLQHPGFMVNRSRQHEIAHKAMEMIQVSLPVDRLVEDLSIAERQLVAMCRALATDAELIIMDEPTSSLTSKEIHTLLSVIRQLKERGISIVFVSHKLDEIISIADRITVLRDGRKIGTYSCADLDVSQVSYLISGENIEYHPPHPLGEKDPVLEVNGLTRSGEFTDVSFTLRRGEVLGIIGLLGSGRTELALSLFGMNPSHRGEIKVDGKSTHIRGVRDAMTAGIAYLPEDRLLQGIVLDQDVEMNTTVSILDRLMDKRVLLDRKQSRRTTSRWIEALRIRSATPEARLYTLSGGNQQKVVLAKWLSMNPKILILDEPTNGVDVSAKSAIYEIIRELTTKGISILLISSEVPEIYRNSHRILVMKKGRIVEEYDAGTVTEEEVGLRAISE